jgi:hypothetical protein
MEIQRRDTAHLEIVLDSRSLNGQKQAIADLDNVIRNWTDKCQDAETCAVILLSAPTDAAELGKLARKKIDLLEKAYEVPITLATRDFPMAGREEDAAINLKKSHLKDLIMLAAIDGQFVREEQLMILEIGLKMGLSERQINSIYNECVLNPEAIESISPSDPEKRLQQLGDLCRVILADGELHDWEAILIFPLAAKMGFAPEDIISRLDDLFEKN